MAIQIRDHFHGQILSGSHFIFSFFVFYDYQKEDVPKMFWKACYYLEKKICSSKKSVTLFAADWMSKAWAQYTNFST
jgi:hypothetical protein